MKIVHISGHVWTHIDNIAKIEGFWQTLMIRVTLRDGAVRERFVDQKDIDKLATEEGYLARKKSYDELMEVMPDMHPAYRPYHVSVEIRYTVEEAFDKLAKEWIHLINYEP